ncbi:Tat binding protein 1-interacting [Anaeromyces robustus]|uniref:Homologous-pairing protein 2 homolog n=1 Tax=Anaeromyces robustus TaxID=1754192 RepID=A0A1Y1XF44_9FUNG|nr:Tat binding protein 1-interacting [Anaeromyces robustus]|eukprot:ORX84379.1 Tat binding protein 1-interacting [Anaeromyces robustus]
MAKPQKTLKDAEAVECILDYLKKQNRPYSAADVYNNLHGAVGKTLVQKILQKASEENKIKEKVYGKQKVYVAIQEDDEFSPEDLLNLDKTIEELQQSLKEKRMKTNSLKNQLNTLNNSMTDEEIVEKLNLIVEENQVLEKRLNSLSEGVKLISKEEQNEIEKSLTYNKLEWKKRKKMFREAWDIITENIEKNPKDLMEELGIETDENS